MRAATSALSVMVALAVLPAAAHAKRAACPPGGHAAVRSNRAFVVFKRTETIGNFYGRVLWTCRRATGRSVRLGPSEECSSSPQAGECFGIGNLVLAGTIVAYSFTEESGSPETLATVHNTVIARNLRTGRLLFNVPSGSPRVREPRLIGVGQVEQVVARPDGTVAWMAVDEQAKCQEFVPCANKQVHVQDRHGGRAIARGLIRVGSLRLRGTTLTWIQNGHTHSYRLH